MPFPPTVRRSASPARPWLVALGEALLASRWAFIVGVFIAYAAHLGFSERIANFDGLGDDGTYFARPALEGLSVIFERKLDGYYVQRILPALVVRGYHKALGLEVTTARVISAFQTLNLVLVTLSAYLYTRVADRLAITPKGRLIGGICIFTSFGVAKWSVFDPVLTDMTAFALGWVFLVACLERRPLLTATAMVIGAFCWPSSLQVGAVLLLCHGLGEPVHAGLRPAPLQASWWLGGLLGLSFAYYGWRTLILHPTPTNLAQPEPWCLMPALGIAGVLLALGVGALGNDATYYQPTRWLRAAFSWPTLLAAGLWLGAGRLHRRYASDGAAFIVLEDLWTVTVQTATHKPAVAPLSHIVFFGPLCLLFFLRGRSIARRMRAAGAGVVAVAVMTVLLATNSESRRLFQLAPFALVFAVAELDRLRLSARAHWVLLAWAAVGSKVWLQIEPNLRTDLLAWPAQSLFMSIGPWMTWQPYLWQGLFVVLAGRWLSSEIQSSRISANAPPEPDQETTTNRTRSTGVPSDVGTVR